MAQLKSLQITRFIAATSVAYLHIKCNPFFGGFGVDIFFVLSGFVMCLVISNGETTKQFLINRLSRIAPLYWLLTVMAFMLAAIAPTLFNSTTANPIFLFKSLFFIPYIKENGTVSPMIPVGWTLNYEIFFYTLIFIALLLWRKYWEVIVSVTLVSIYIVSMQQDSKFAYSIFFGYPIYLEFILGIFLYKVYAKKQNIFKQISPYIAMTLVCISYLAMVLVDLLEITSYRYLFLGIPASIFVFGALGLEKSIPSISPRLIAILVAMGNASYATYLSHLYVVEGIRKVFAPRAPWFDIYSPVGVCLTLIAVLIVGQLIYILLDKILSGYCKMKLTKALN
jgi:exopolysaccharide production protein ExoZ